MFARGALWAPGPESAFKERASPVVTGSGPGRGQGRRFVLWVCNLASELVPCGRGSHLVLRGWTPQPKKRKGSMNSLLSLLLRTTWKILCENVLCVPLPSLNSSLGTQATHGTFFGVQSSPKDPSSDF